MIKALTARGVVGALPMLLLVVMLNTTTDAQSSAHVSGQQRGNPAFAAAWERGTAVSVTGELTVVYADDFKNRRSELVHMIRDARTGKSFQLRFEQQAPRHLKSGDRVTISGRSVDSELYVGACCESMTSAAGSNLQTSSPSTAAVTGDQRTLVMAANFSDAALSCSAGAINNMMFADPKGQSVAAVYADNSLGQLSMSGDVVGPYTIAMSSAGPCDLNAWASAVKTAAASAGVDLASYTHHVVVLPQNSCYGTGMGTVGGSPSLAWIFMCDDYSIYEHELGHNFGMDHASTDDGTTTYEYGDNTDAMGISTGSVLKGFNAPHRHQMGWLGQNAAQLITHDGFYNVAPLALDPNAAAAPQDLLIAKPNTSEYYHLSYRTPIGFENGFDVNAYSALSVHRFMGNGLPDLHTYRLALLKDGQSFVDSLNGIAVAMVSHNVSYATIQVTLTGAPCVTSAPAISASPSVQGGKAGSTLSYAVTVTNLDSAVCPSTSFQIGTTLPAGWSAAPSSPTVSLGPGQSGTVTLPVTSASGAALGRYSIAANVSDPQLAAHVGVASMTYDVQDATAPTAPGALTATLSKTSKQIQLTWKAATDNVGVAGYRVWRNNAVIGAATTTSWIDQAIGSKATYTYWVAAFDAAGNVSAASNSVTVSVGGSTGKR